MTTFVVESSFGLLQKPCSVETAVRTKIVQMTRMFADRYLIIGQNTNNNQQLLAFFQDLRQNKSLELDLIKVVGTFEQTFKLAEGSVRFGKLLYPGIPYCILLPVDYDLNSPIIKTLYKKACLLLQDLKVDPTLPEIKQKISFGLIQWCFYSHLIAFYIPSLAEISKVVVQSHDWESHIGSLLYRKYGPAHSVSSLPTPQFNKDLIRTVLTLHQTILGRALTNQKDGFSLQQLFESFKGKSQDDIDQQLDKLAEQNAVLSRHLLEKECAKQTDIVTCISEICAQEVKFLLDKQNVEITSNGVHVNSVRGEIDDHELISTYNTVHSRILEFIRVQFQNYDNLKTYIFVMSGRYEFINKGFDIFIEALSYVNKQLQDEGFLNDFPSLRGKNIVAFMISPTETKGLSGHTTDGSNMLKDMNISIDDMIENLQQKLVKKLCSSTSLNFGQVSLEQLLSPDDLLELTRFQQLQSQHTQTSPLTTHELVNPNSQIIQSLLKHGLDNKTENKVKVLWIPEYLTSTSVVGIDYLQFIKGCDLGCFVPKYEPFGYGALECMCVGTPSIVSDLAGFGCFMKKLQQQTQQIGDDDNIITRSQKIQQKATDEEFKSKEKRVESFGHLGDAAKQPQQQSYSQDDATQRNLWSNNKFGVNVISLQQEGSHQRTILDIGGQMLEVMKLKRHEATSLRTRSSHNSVVCDWSVQINEYMKVYEKV